MRVLRRFAVTILGVLLLAAGLAMMVLPGPGIVVIVAGLAVLATEYVWARRLLEKAKDQAQQAQEAAVASPLRTAGSVAFALGMVALGVVMLVVQDVAWPFLAGPLDAAWGPVTGGILVVSGVVVLTTTAVTVRAARGQETTYSQHDDRAPDAAA